MHKVNLVLHLLYVNRVDIHIALVNAHCVAQILYVVSNIAHIIWPYVKLLRLLCLLIITVVHTRVCPVLLLQLHISVLVFLRMT